MDLDHHIEQLSRGELLSEGTVKGLTSKLKDMLIYESNVEHVRAPVTVVGDIFGCVSFLRKCAHTARAVRST
jgi:hypothetical protein